VEESDVKQQGQEELRRAHYELEKRMEERTTELARTDEALKAEIAERKRIEELSKALNDINLTINSTLDFDEIMRNVIGKSTRAIGAETSAIGLREEGYWVLRYTFRLPEEYEGRRMTDEESPVTALAARTKSIVVSNDVYGDRRFRREIMEQQRIRSILVIPLIVRGDVIGAISFHHHSAAVPFAEAQVDFAGNLGASLSLAILNARLYEERERWTAELARSNAELEQFAYIASHDLLEPLRMVSGFTQLLAKRYKGKLDKDANDFISYIVDGATRMQKMIDDLLEYSRVGRRGKPFERTDLEAVLNQTLTNLKVSIEQNNAAVTHDPLPAVMADATQMVQLFQNLISNAIKFRKTDEPPRIRILAERKGDEWIFSVRDNGIGIAPEFMGRLFQVFARGHAASEYPGTGIGLAICKRIVERHGGRIWAESEPGKGSTFYFTIPARDAR